jgi:hypothetical protein
MRNFIIYITIVLSVTIASCGSTNQVPSGKASKQHNGDPSSGFSSQKSKTSRKPPQMGFYEKKSKTNIFQAIKFKTKYVFASKEKRHKYDNDQKSTSQSYANKKQKDSVGEMNKTFVKGKAKRSKKKNTSYDNNSDSFRAPKKKKRE